jgi:hypothetical protein
MVGPRDLDEGVDGEPGLATSVLDVIRHRTMISRRFNRTAQRGWRAASGDDRGD